MKGQLLLISTFLLSLGLSAQPYFDWTKSGKSDFSAYGTGIAMDENDSSVVVCGNYTPGSSIDFKPPLTGFPSLPSPAAGIEGYLAKFDSIGNHLWSTTIGRMGDEVIVNDVAIASNSKIVIVGKFKGNANFRGTGSIDYIYASTGGTWDGFVVQLDEFGVFSWIILYSGSGIEEPLSVEYEFSKIWVCGYYEAGTGILGFSPEGGKDGFVAGYTNGGALHTKRKIAGPGDDYISETSTDGSDLYVTGTISNGAGTYTSGDVLENGPYSVTGLSDCYVGKFDVNFLAFTWVKQIKSDVAAMGNAIKIDGSKLYVSGSSHGNTTFPPSTLLPAIASQDIFLTKINISNGNTQWEFKEESTTPGNVNFNADLAVDANGDVHVLSSFKNSVTFSGKAAVGTPTNSINLSTYDVAITSYDPNGNLLNTYSEGTVGDDSGTDMSINIMRMAITGTYNSIITGMDFGVNPVLSNGSGSNSMFVAYSDLLNVVQPCNAAFNYDFASYCQSAGSISPNYLGDPGGTFSAPAGLSINTSSGIVNLGTSTPAAYDVTYTGAGACSEIFNLTVTVDNPPTVTFCPSNILQGTTIGSCSSLVTYLPPTGTDDCGPITITQTDGTGLTSGNIFPVGTTMQTYSLTDNNTQSSTCSFSVTIVDSEDPQITCPGNISVNNDAGSCGANVLYSAPLGSDNCPGAVTNQTDLTGYTSGSLFPVGSTTLEYTVTDASGNTNVCSFNITVNDTQFPTISCPADITINAAAGLCSKVVTYTDPIGIDNCPGMFTTQTDGTGLTSGSQFPVGIATLEYTVTDASSNAAVCSFDITVVDAKDPDINCPLDISVVAGSGSCGATIVYTPPIGTDNCPGAVTTQTDATGLSSGSFFPVDITVIEYTVTDASLNVSNCSFSVTVLENEDPVINCPLDITVNNDLGSCDALVIYSIPIGTDNCPGPVTAQTDATGLSSGSTFPIGTTTLEYTVTDGTGNSAICSFDITVNDTENPSINCPADITINADAGLCSKVVTYIVPIGIDNCPGMVTTQTDATGLSSGSTFPVGTTTLEYTVTDASSNTTICSFDITALDAEDPAINCPSDISIVAGFGSCGATVVYTPPIGTDNCPGPVTTQTDATGLSSGSFFPVGMTVTEFTVTDASLNVAICSFSITVLDNEDPTISCVANVTQDTDVGLCAALVNSIAPSGSTENCPVIGLSYDIIGATVASGFFDASGTIFNLGTSTVTYTIVDGAGNSASCNFDVIIEDNETPNANCKDITIQLDGIGTANIADGDVDNGSNDACGIASLSLNQTTFTCADVGAHVLTLSVTDNNGNTATCNATVTVEDNVVPLMSCQDVTVNLLATGNTSITFSDIDNGTTDNCGIASLNLDITAFTCAEVGTNSVVLTALDVNGNSNTCAATVTVIDNIPPIALCQDLTIALDILGVASITTTDVDNASTDNCVIATYSLDPTNFNCSNVGLNNVTLTVDDVNGNSSNCSAIITVIDDIAPNAICQDITVQLDATGNVSISATDIDNASSDACGISTSVLDVADFTCAAIGINSETLTITDVNSNVSSCGANVTVEDNVGPLMSCQDVTVNLDATGNATITVTDIDNGTTDNCGIASLNLDITAFTCAEVGPNSVVLTALDQNGNSNSCAAIATVIDDIPPIAICQNLTIVLDALGNTSITTTDVDNASTDNCAIATYTLDQTNFDCSHVGPNSIELTVDDVNGNSSDCSATITVIDDIAINAICQDITVQLDATGNVSISANDIDNGSSDACGISSRILDVTDFTCADLGVNPVTLTLTDVNSNVSSCGANITVEDNVVPVMSCQDVTVNLDATGNATITVTDIDNGTTDNCGIASLSLDITAFTCAEVGTNPVVLTALDVNGNSNSCAASVTVIDNIPPIAICQNLTIVLDVLGNASITTTDVDNASTDNCAIATYALDQTNFDCSHVGLNNVTLTVDDVNGISSNCSAIIAVIDDIAPNAICQDITVQLDATGNVSISANDMDNGSSDACGISSIVLDVADFTCAAIGINSVTLTITDVNSNVSSCGANVTVEESMAPVVTSEIQNLTVPNQLGVCGAFVSWDEIIAIDNCTSVNTGYLPPQGSFFPVGNTIVTVSLTDDYGNSIDTSFQITVLDSEAPEIFDIPIDIVQSNDPGACWGTVNWNLPYALDNCLAVMLASNFISGEQFPVGTTEVIYTASDPAGNESIASFFITVLDNEFPFFDNCPGPINVTSGLNSCGASVTWIPPTALDNCMSEGLDVSSNYQPGDVFPIGTTTVTYTVLDINNNPFLCEFTVTVTDDQAPEFTYCPDDKTVVNDIGECGAIVSWDLPDVFDNCSAILSSTHNPDEFFVVGSTLVTYYAQDPYGNQDSCMFTITVTDNELPSIVCEAYITSCDDFIEIESPDAVDNCGVASITNSLNGTSTINAVFPEGETSIYWSLIDIHGNVDSCEMVINVLDQNPIISAGLDQTLDMIDFTVLNADTMAGMTGFWEIIEGDGIISDPTDPGTAVFDLSIGDNTFVWTITNGGCFSVSDTVNIVMRNFFIPDGFSPNGDKVNDQFEIVGIHLFPENRLKMFNRWGQLVFEKAGYLNEWTGNNLKGKPLPNDTYYYVLEMTGFPTQKGFIAVKF